MRHGKRRSSFGRMPAHRDATIRHLVTALFKYQRITTTVRKAKEARRLAEKLITIARAKDVNAERQAFSYLVNRDVVHTLFHDVLPLCKDRTSGFTRIMHVGFRRGDGAPLAILELTDRKIVEKTPKKVKAKKQETKKGVEEKPHKKEVAHDTETPKKRQSQTPSTTTSKSKLTLEEEKAKEKAKSEDKLISNQGKGFFKNLRTRFRRRGNDS